MSRRIDAILMTILVGDVVVPLFRPAGDRQDADGRLACHRADKGLRVVHDDSRCWALARSVLLRL